MPDASNAGIYRKVLTKKPKDLEEIVWLFSRFV